MKKFIDTIKNIFSIEELRSKIINTLGLLLIFRLGSYIVLPGLDPIALAKNTNSEGILGLINIFSGGAFSRSSIFALGIMPYISASIVIQLLTIAIPYFQRMQRDGDSGRKRMNQITRVLTILIALAQGSAYIAGTIPAEAIMIDRFFFTVSAMMILTTGTMFCMWLGERIEDRGIGNGISMLIMIGIISRLPFALISEGASKGSSGMLLFVLELVALFFVVMGVVLITQAVRRIPIQYAKQIVGKGSRNKALASTGQRSFLPLKITTAGVMPIIFAQSLMFVPSLIGSALADSSDVAVYIYTKFSDFTSWQYNVTVVVLIVLFTYFYTAITINPKQIADEMQRNGGFIPGVEPGEPTAEYIGSVIDKITLPGALFLSALAVMPAFAAMAGITSELAQFYGGTSLLIMVGVILDTLQRIESYLLMKHYEGMMQSGEVGTSELEMAEVVK
jgi:preprotein translocase subunit SecY